MGFSCVNALTAQQLWKQHRINASQSIVRVDSFEVNPILCTPLNHTCTHCPPKKKRSDSIGEWIHLDSANFRQTRAKNSVKIQMRADFNTLTIRCTHSLPHWWALCHPGADNPLYALFSGCAAIYRQIKMFTAFDATNFIVRSKFSACGAAKPNRNNSIFSNLFRQILWRRFSASVKEMRESRIWFIIRRHRLARIFRLGHLLKETKLSPISWMLFADFNRHYFASLFLEEKTSHEPATTSESHSLSTQLWH